MPVNVLKSRFYLLYMSTLLFGARHFGISINTLFWKLYSGRQFNYKEITLLFFFVAFLCLWEGQEAACGLELIMSPSEARLLIVYPVPHELPGSAVCLVEQALSLPCVRSKWFFSYHDTFLVGIGCYLKKYYHLYYVLLCFG